jgi:RNA polymerase sigma-70 factor (ECF subfamily)
VLSRKQKSEERLIRKAVAGDMMAFSQLLEKYQQLVFKVCLGLLQNRMDAEDVSQEVFVAAYQSLSKFKGDAAFSTWLYRIAINKSNNFRQRNRRAISLFEMNDGKAIRTAHQFLAVDSADQGLVEEDRRKMLRLSLIHI